MLEQLGDMLIENIGLYPLRIQKRAKQIRILAFGKFGDGHHEQKLRPFDSSVNLAKSAR